MPKVIAMAGKGGTGKTTISALLINYMLHNNLTPILAVDADANANLNELLNMDVATGFDLLVMGQPDGPGCYCAANQHLAMTMDKLADNYKFILVDNEAGMEHLSRMNLRSIDILLVISDPSARGILTAKRISELTKPLKIEIKEKYLIVNRTPDPLPDELYAKIKETTESTDLPLAGIISSSNQLIRQELSGKSYLELAEDATVIQQAYEIFSKIIK
jgi:CO dehydrogenase maturation factor